MASAASSTSCPFPGVTAATQQQLPASSRSRGEVCRVGARLRDADPVGMQRVVVEQPAPGPGAGRDHRDSGRQSLPFPALGMGGDLVTRQPMPQGHVHQDDEAQPACLGHQDLRDMGGDEAVDHDDGAVGDLRQRAAQVRARRGFAPGPRAGHGPLAHRPSERAEPTTDSAVIGVAAAGPRRVIDAVRDDHVYGSHRLTLETRPGDMRLVQGDRDPGQSSGCLAQRPGIHPISQPVCDDLGQRLGGGVRAGEPLLLVEVAVVQAPRARREVPPLRARCRRRCCRGRSRPPKRGIDDVGGAVQALRGSEGLAAQTVGDHHVVPDGHAEHRSTPRRS